MGGACKTREKDEKFLHKFSFRYLKEDSSWRHSRRLGDNEMDVK
jgi:hypothetical protein